MAKCKNCLEGDKTWTQDENGKWRLLNADGSRHFCMGSQGQQQQQQTQAQQQPQVQLQQPQVPQQQQYPSKEEWDKLRENVAAIAQFYEGLVSEMQIISKSIHKSFLIQDKAEQFLEQSRITDAKVDRILALVQNARGDVNQDDELSRPGYREKLNAFEDKLVRAEEEYDRDKEEGTIGFGDGGSANS
jgi:hypothetical protein